MSKVFVIGAGFAGLSAAGQLSKAGIDVTVIDKKQTFDFLPALPDCIGRRISPQYLAYKIEDAAKRTGFKYINDEVTAVDLTNRRISAKKNAFSYDFLVLASGSETNFYNNENIKKAAYKLDDASDAAAIVNMISRGSFETYIVAGGGYTGVELATNVAVFLNKNKRQARVIVVERADSLLGPLPLWMKKYTMANFKRLNIETIVNSQVEKVDGNRVYVSANRAFDNAFLIWAAGVKTADFLQVLNVEKNPQGRIRVDEYLRVDERCFVAGDAAYFLNKGGFLRMAVQFSVAQGNCAAKNIINSIKGAKLIKYKPFDAGFIIPMANNMSCGAVLGLNLKGLLPTALHFIMCAYRSLGYKNKTGIMKGLVPRIWRKFGGEI